MNRASCAKHRCGFLLRRAEMDAMRSRADRIDALLGADAGSEASADDDDEADA